MSTSMAKHRIPSLSLALSIARNLSTATSGAAAVSGKAEDRNLLHRRLSALRGSRKGSVSETMESWVNEGKAVTSANLIICVRQLRKSKDYKHALDLIDWMDNIGMDMPVSTHAIRLELISKVNGIDKAEVYFSTIPHSSNNHKTCTALLASYCQGKLVDKALSLFEKMKELNLTLNPLVFNNLMTLYVKSGHPEKVATLVEEMRAVNISPDRITYGLLINSYILLKDVDSVERIVKEMGDGRVAFDWPIICGLASFYNSSGLFKKSESILKKAEKFMNRYDRAPYEYLISLYAGAGNLAEVLRVWKLLKAAFKKTTNKSYFIMLSALRQLGDADGLKQCFQEWESSYSSYDVRLANVAIDVYLKNGMAEETKSIWRKSVENGAGSDIRTLELFTKYYLETGELDLAIEFLRIMVHAEKPTGWRSVVDVLLKQIEEAKDVDGMNELCEILMKLDSVNGES